MLNLTTACRSALSIGITVYLKSFSTSLDYASTKAMIMISLILLHHCFPERIIYQTPSDLR